MNDADLVLAVDDVHLSVEDAEGEALPILRGVSLELRRGEILGLVGESGSGKSLTARVIAGLLPMRSTLRGRVLFEGADLVAAPSQRWRQVRAESIAMIFQDPRAQMDPVRTIGDYLAEALTQLRGMSRAEAERRAIDVLGEVGVNRPEARLRQYPHELSGGLLQRVMIAAALLAQPSVLLADEPTTALDVTTQSELMHVLEQHQRAQGMSVLFISHDLDLAAAISDQLLVMYAGEIVERGVPSAVESAPKHPYTEALLSARPQAFGPKRRLVQLEGAPISAAEVGVGCAFQNRCPRAIDVCEQTRPELVEAGASAWRCLRVEAATVTGTRQ